MDKILGIDSNKYNRPLSQLIRLLQLIIRVYLKFVDDAGFARAGGLAFSTLISIVPFAALIISLLSAFGALDTVKDQIMDTIVQLMIPTRQLEVTDMMNGFLENSNTLGVVGLVFFLITSIFLLNTVTENMNAVWGSKPKSNFISKFTTYASVLIFGTLLIAASTTITSRFTLSQIAHIENIAFLNRILLKIAPFIFDFFVIMLLIGLVPSGRVKLKYLLIVSVVGALFWEVLKFGFFNLSTWALRMSIIYGTIAIIPIFLFWIFIIWIIIICAMETAWIMQHKENAWKGKPLMSMLPVERLTFGFELFLFIAAAYESGRKMPTSETLADEFSVSIRDIHEMTSQLAASTLLLQAGEDGMSWIPARSLTKIKTTELINVVFGRSATVDPASGNVINHIERFYKGGILSIEDSCIADLLAE